MTLKKSDPTKIPAWKKLQEHYRLVKAAHMKDWFANDPGRADLFTICWDDFYVDYSKHRITQKTLQLFNELADSIDLKDAISKYFSGDAINETESRAVLHTALRVSSDAKIEVNGQNVMEEIIPVRQKMKNFTDSVIVGTKKGYTGKPFTDVVNIGIGGSDLGPAMVVDALKFYGNHLNMHFVSNVDGDHVREVLKGLDPETTLFIIVSKSFTTQETLTNASTIKEWFLTANSEADVSKHFIAVSANIEKVKTFGITEDNIFPMWDWVGGRFSLWSAVGLSICLAIGYENFSKLLKGARKMDVHFKTRPFDENIPVILAFLSIWYNNFFGAETEAIIPYSHYLNQFATYLQQAIMESNGKGVDRDGVVVNYQTGNIIWGEPGTNAQHAFFQLMHQGTKMIPADFIGFRRSLHGEREHHNKLMSNFFAQTEALMIGRTEKELERQIRSEVIPYKVFEGNRPTTTILIDRLSPESLGKLIALYEHKIFIQGVIWNIFSYDQFGVELGKQLAGNILNAFNNESDITHDSSTQNLIRHYKSID